MIIREAIIREADDCPKERTRITPNDEGRRTAFLAQLDRAIVFEAIGCKFDSCRTLGFLHVRSLFLWVIPHSSFFVPWVIYFSRLPLQANI